MKTLAQVLSVVLLPLWIPFVLSLYLHPITLPNVSLGLGSIFVLLLMVWMYKRTGLLLSLQMPHRTDRLLPLASSVLVYLFFAVLSYYVALKMFAVFILAAILVFLLYLCTYWIKVSIHVAGVCTLSIWLMISLQGSWQSVVLSLGLMGLVIFARTQLKAHTWIEMGLGTLVGGLGGWIWAMLFLSW